MKQLLSFFICVFLSCALIDQTPYSKQLEQKAKEGDVTSMLELGDAYMNGYDTKKNPKEAVKWYEKAAEKKSELAYQKLIDAYSDWDKMGKDEKKVSKLLEKGAKDGIPSMMFEYGKKSLEEGYSLRAAYNFEDAYEEGCQPAAAYAAYSFATSLYPDYIKGYFYACEALESDNLTEEEKSLANGAAALSLAMMNFDFNKWQKYYENTNEPKILYKIAMTILPGWSEEEYWLLDETTRKHYEDLIKYHPTSKYYANIRENIINKLPENSAEQYFVQAMQDYKDQDFESSFKNIKKAADLENMEGSIIMATAFNPNDFIAKQIGLVVNPTWPPLTESNRRIGYSFDNFWLDLLSRMAIEKFRSPDEALKNQYLKKANRYNDGQAFLNQFYYNPIDIIANKEIFDQAVEKSAIARSHFGRLYLDSPGYKKEQLNQLNEKANKAAREAPLKTPVGEINAFFAYLNKGKELSEKALNFNNEDLSRKYLDKAYRFMLFALKIAENDFEKQFIVSKYLNSLSPDKARELFRRVYAQHPNEIILYFISGKNIDENVMIFAGRQIPDIVDFYKELLKNDNLSSDVRTEVRRYVSNRYNEAI